MCCPPTDIHPGPNGQFTIPGMPPGEHTIGLMGPGGGLGVIAHAQVRRGRTTHVGDLTPGPTGSIADTVTRQLAGGGTKPVEGIAVMARPGHLDDPMQQETAPQAVGHGLGMAVLNAFTDASGTYEIEGVPAGDYDAMALGPGQHPDAQHATAVEGQTVTVDFTLAAAPASDFGTVSGTVAGQAVGPIEDARTMVMLNHPWAAQMPHLGPSGDSARAMNGPNMPDDPGPSPAGGMGHWVEIAAFMTVTDAQGRYSLDLPPGTHDVQCWAPGWEW